MTIKNDIEILRREWDSGKGTESTTIRASFEQDGSLRISGHDMGPSVERHWRDPDFEYWMTIKAEDLQRFVLVVLKEAFSGQKPLSFRRLREVLDAAGIKNDFSTWA